MYWFTQEDIEELNALSNDTISVTATATSVKFQLHGIVAVSNYKTIASAGRAGKLARFDSYSKTLTIKILPIEDLKIRQINMIGEDKPANYFHFEGLNHIVEDGDLERPNLLGLYPYKNFSNLKKLAKRLGGDKAKKFKKISDAFASRNKTRMKKEEKVNESGEFRYGRPEDMDIPMWHDSDGGFWYDLEIMTISD